MSASSNAADILRNANFRLCRIQLWDNYNGFGFNLKFSSKPPHIIQSVQPFSPAAAGGLQTLDVIIAIDEQDISSSDYNQVIDNIKYARDSNGLVELLVVEQRFYRSLVKKNIKFDINVADIKEISPTMPVNYQNYHKYQPRTCRIYLKGSEEKFGFDIADGRNDIGAFIEKIHPNTPASRTILRKNDRIIEINGKSVDKKRRKSIYKKLESAKLKGYVKLYVVDIETYNHYQVEKISLSSKKHRKIPLATLDRNYISVGGVEAISTMIGKGRIVVEQGDITMQKVDVIIASSSSDFLRQAIIRRAGKEVDIAYNNEFKKNPNAILIPTSSGALYCKRIFFIKWEPVDDQKILQRSLIDLISTVIQNMISNNFTSIAFPAIGCGQHGCSIDIVVKTMVREMKSQLTERNLSWMVKFVIQPDQSDIYDEFCKQVLTPDDEYQLIQTPSTWEKSAGDKIRFVLSTTSDEYKSIVPNFEQAMKGNYRQIVRVERIQNERWYTQYLAHSKDFKKRLNMDTEKRLYHGCPEQAAASIIKDCFNRSFAGVNGTKYGVGVYFSSDAVYSHGYTRRNANGERCMFVARVLIGKTTRGDSSMKTRPLEFDSTTDNNHIFVTYHDAQAFAEYLITYK